MKKLISMLLVLTLVFRLVACGASKTTFQIKTVGEALLAEGLIAGESSDYGLYITTVNGITLDWEKDGKYWAFYINGEYAQTGADTTEIQEGATYAFKAE